MYADAAQIYYLFYHCITYLVTCCRTVTGTAVRREHRQAVQPAGQRQWPRDDRSQQQRVRAGLERCGPAAAGEAFFGKLPDTVQMSFSVSILNVFLACGAYA